MTAKERKKRMLFNHMIEYHDLILNDTELRDIILIIDPVFEKEEK
jgi:hypothetical protein